MSLVGESDSLSTNSPASKESTMALNEQTRERIESIIRGNDVVLFMKGNRAMPQCGFSGKVVQILDGLVQDYTTVDVLEDPAIREGIKEYSEWPTIPQLYREGRVRRRLRRRSPRCTPPASCTEQLGLAAPERKIPTVRITDAAAARLREYIAARARQGPQAVDRRALPGVARSGAAPGARRGGRVERHARADGLRPRPSAPTACRSTWSSRRPALPSRSTTPTRRPR